MTVNATTLARVKAFLGVAASETVTTETTARDALLTALVDGVSREFERYIGYELEQKSRVEYYSPELGIRLIQLLNVPVVSVTEVRTASEGTWNFTTGLALTSDSNYRASLGKVGEIYFLDGALIFGFETLKITYVAGVGTNDAGVIAAAPDLSDAADMQVAEEWRRKSNPSTVSKPGPKGPTVYDSPHVLLPRVRQRLSAHVRYVVV